MIRKKKVLVALSGGVDSTMVAALLKQQGFDVVGIFFPFFDPTWKLSFQVKKIAKNLDIPIKIVDARDQFKKKVVNYFIDSYKKGLTPNPCVQCNKEMKFGLLFELLKKYKADFVATGHYARLGREFSIFNFQFSNNEKISKFKNIKLLEALDKTKDQSYFLYKLNQKELARIIFPLGDYKKDEVKKLAKKWKLSVAGGGESQDVCFLSGKDTSAYFKKYIKSEPGNIVDEKGEILGKHKGLIFYTLGQRKGIEIGGKGPYFVVGKNAKKNELVASNNQRRLLSKIFEVRQINWIRRDLKFPLRAQVQVRYHSEKIPAIIGKTKKGKWEVKSKNSLRAVTPGQSAVFFQGEEVLGGGIIK